MLEVKIPSPPIAKIKSHISENNLDTAQVIRGYMDTLTNSIKFISKGDFSYTAGRVSDEGIFATIDVQQLPLYDKVAGLFDSINFEQAMISQIAIGNRHYGYECPIANKKNLRQPLSSWSGRWITIYLWTMLRADFSMRFLASPKQLVDNSVLMDALIERLGANQSQVAAQSEVVLPTATAAPTEVAEVSTTPEITTTAQQESLPTQKDDTDGQALTPKPADDILAMFEAQAQADDVEQEAITAVETPTLKTDKAEQTINTDFDMVAASKAVTDCMDMEALDLIIRKSNNRAVELHCMAQSMDLVQVIAERQVISSETTNAITAMVSELLTTINNNPDFFEDPSRFKIESTKEPIVSPINEDKPF